MWYNVNINYVAISKKYINIWSKKLDNFSSRVVKWVKSRTPEDKWKLEKSIWKTEQTFTWRFILQQVKSLDPSVDYVPPVEYWVMWKVYNYHKPKWSVFFSWIWAWMFRKTWFDLKDKFNENE